MELGAEVRTERGQQGHHGLTSLVGGVMNRPPPRGVGRVHIHAGLLDEEAHVLSATPVDQPVQHALALLVERSQTSRGRVEPPHRGPVTLGRLIVQIAPAQRARTLPRLALDVRHHPVIRNETAALQLTAGPLARLSRPGLERAAAVEQQAGERRLSAPDEGVDVRALGIEGRQPVGGPAQRDRQGRVAEGVHGSEGSAGRRSLIMAESVRCAAIWRAVRPSVSDACTSAPSESSRRAVSALPSSAASRRGVRPPASRASRSAPLADSRSIRSRSPANTAR